MRTTARGRFPQAILGVDIHRDEQLSNAFRRPRAERGLWECATIIDIGLDHKLERLGGLGVLELLLYVLIVRFIDRPPPGPFCSGTLALSHGRAFSSSFYEPARHNNFLSNEEVIEGTGSVTSKLRSVLEQTISDVLRFLSASNLPPF